MGFTTPKPKPTPKAGSRNASAAMKQSTSSNTNSAGRNFDNDTTATPCKREGSTDDSETKSWKCLNTLVTMTPFTPATEATTPMSSFSSLFAQTPMMSTPRHHYTTSTSGVVATTTTATTTPAIVVEEDLDVTYDENKENGYLAATETPDAKWRVRALFQDGGDSSSSDHLLSKYEQEHPPHHDDLFGVKFNSCRSTSEEQDYDEQRLLRTDSGLNFSRSNSTSSMNASPRNDFTIRSSSVIRTRKATTTTTSSSIQYNNDNIGDSATSSSSSSSFGISERRRTRGRAGSPSSISFDGRLVDGHAPDMNIDERGGGPEFLQSTPDIKARNYKRSYILPSPGIVFDFTTHTTRRIPSIIINLWNDILAVSKHLLCRPRIDTILVWLLLTLGICSMFLLIKTNRSMMLDNIHPPGGQQIDHPYFIVNSNNNPTPLLLQQQQSPYRRPAAGLRGELVQTLAGTISGRRNDNKGHGRKATEEKKDKDKKKKKHHEKEKKDKKDIKKDRKDTKKKDQKIKPKKKPRSTTTLKSIFKTIFPSNWKKGQKQAFNSVDSKMFAYQDDASTNASSEKENKHEETIHSKRVVILHNSIKSPTSTAAAAGKTKLSRREIELYPSEFTDNTQLYSVLDSGDERLQRMELREPYVQGECVPMQDWQTSFHPFCNGMHELGLEYLGEDDRDNGMDVKLFGTKGYWRNAWKYDSLSGHFSSHNSQDRDTVVLKTLKFQHTFEDAHFEHDRIDAIAMERLTSSPHVVNVFGYCGHSVLTEYADGKRLGELADKSRSKKLARLRIARDIANGLADVHGIDGDGNATFVHLDINPANVLSIGGTLKLNDFNIGIIRRWNITSQKPCGFPAQYPNPQWRSPEEARNEDNLTEKVDIFAMGHIFFRLICGHEPWNKLEPNGRPSKEEVNEKVQKGILPYIPKDIMKSKDEEVIVIRDEMLKCYKYDPKERPAARDIAKTLEKALDRLTQDSKAQK